MTRTVDAALIGVGNVGRNFLRILETKGGVLRQRYGVTFRVVCVADSSGMAVDLTGLDPGQVRRVKETGGRVADLPAFQPQGTPEAFLAQEACDLVLESSPVNLQTGAPGLPIVRAALSRGVSCVLANKAPLVLAFQELQDLAARSGAGLAYSATVCGALPVINIGQRDLIAAEVSRLRGIFNSTSNFILEEMAGGRPYAAALAEAQARGIAEADPSLDVEGWDTANKLVIIANSFLGVRVTLDDVAVTGITHLTAEELQRHREQGETVRLVAEARRRPEGSYALSVQPTPLPEEDFLARCSGWEMGVEIHSDLYGKMYHKIWEREPLPTAAAMLRDAVNLFGNTRVPVGV